MMYLFIWFTLLLITGCHNEPTTVKVENKQVQQLLEAAVSQIGKTVHYDGSYQKLAYPNGDVPLETGVCSDVVIRALRGVGIDLQVLVHQDMRRAFKHYPNHWGLKKTDHNIDHRRVYNLQTFFQRQGKAISVSHRPADYLPGDFVTWVFAKNLPHIGIVSHYQSQDKKRLLIIHNAGAGTQRDDVLFKYQITGHYRYFSDD